MISSDKRFKRNIIYKILILLDISKKLTWVTFGLYERKRILQSSINNTHCYQNASIIMQVSLIISAHCYKVMCRCTLPVHNYQAISWVSFMSFTQILKCSIDQNLKSTDKISSTQLELFLEILWNISNQ